MGQETGDFIIDRPQRHLNCQLASLRIAAKCMSMKGLAAIYRKLGGATLLLALWLSLVPAAQANATHSYSSLDTSASAVLTQLLVSKEIVLTEGAAVAQEELGRSGDGSDDAPGLSLYRVPAPMLAPSQLHGLPESTGPPPSSPLRHFQARAPPVA